MVPRIIKTGVIPAYMIRVEEQLLFEISKNEVDSCVYARFDQFAEQLGIAKKHSREKVSIAFYEPVKEWCNIAGVREYLRHMFTACPHFVYFAYPNAQTVSAFLRCLSIKENGADVDMDLYRKNVAETVSAVEAHGAAINDLRGANEIITRYGFRYV